MARLPEGHMMEPVTGRIIPIPKRSASRRRFMGRLSLAEQAALNKLRKDVDGDPDTAAFLETLADLRDASQPIEFDDPDTVYGVALSINYLTTLPEGHYGRIDPADAAARVDAWLADYPQPGEPT